MTRILVDCADTVFTATNGKEALKIFSKETIHCVVCDINMPGMNGVEVIKNIREKHGHVPFIFYTGHGNQQLMLEVIKYGAFDFLNKPNMQDLEDLVIKGLEHGVKGKGPKNESPSESDYRKLLDSQNP